VPLIEAVESAVPRLRELRASAALLG
jgi:hypothetical protein